MTTELFVLTLTALLAASLWVPYVVGVNTTPVAAPAENRPHEMSGTVPWVHRAWRAHQNLLEQFLPFAVLVLIGHVAGVTSPLLGILAAVFLGLRLAHAYWMIAGHRVLPVRPMIFTGGWLVILAYAGVLLTA